MSPPLPPSYPPHVTPPLATELPLEPLPLIAPPQSPYNSDEYKYDYLVV